METQKPTHTLVLDAGPILKNEPPVSSLLAQAEALITVPAVISEIRDAAARSRVETTLLPFVTLRNPTPASVKVITDFARKTGDFEVLSRPDVQILALAYELECERNGGDWRLRKTPGQKRMNGPPPKKAEIEAEEDSKCETSAEATEDGPSNDSQAGDIPATEAERSSMPTRLQEDERPLEDSLKATQLSDPISNDDVQEFPAEEAQEIQQEATEPDAPSGESDLDSEGWVTPSNIKTYQAREAALASTTSADTPKVMQVATITTDFAMQNVLLQMNLNLLSPSLRRIRHLKTYILRCHGCFSKTKDMSKQFCPRCGKPTLLRVSCTTLDNGEFKIHLKKNMQWNTRGNKFRIPKPVGGSASGKLNVGGGGKGGGKGGWGQGLILAEDQKEYVQAMTGASRRKERDLMDEDYLPGILTGDRGRAGGRPKVGGGRNINSRKRM